MLSLDSQTLHRRGPAMAVGYTKLTSRHPNNQSGWAKWRGAYKTRVEWNWAWKVSFQGVCPWRLVTCAGELTSLFGAVRVERKTSRDWGAKAAFGAVCVERRSRDRLPRAPKSLKRVETGVSLICASINKLLVLFTVNCYLICSIKIKKKTRASNSTCNTGHWAAEVVKKLICVKHQ